MRRSALHKAPTCCGPEPEALRGTCARSWRRKLMHKQSNTRITFSTGDRYRVQGTGLWHLIQETFLNHTRGSEYDLGYIPESTALPFTLNPYPQTPVIGRLICFRAQSVLVRSMHSSRNSGEPLEKNMEYEVESRFICGSTKIICMGIIQSHCNQQKVVVWYLNLFKGCRSPL